MAEIAASSAAATKCTDVLVDKVTKELPYLCCYKSYAAEFEEKKGELSAAVESVDMKIKEAKRRNETQIDPLVKHWVRKANNFIQQETRPKKWFGFCNDWFSQYSLAKKLERIMQEIPTIMEKAENFSQVARAAGPPGMEFYSQEFMHFKSRNLVYEQLREELKNDNIHRIGLQAMGGSGKTTMTKAIGKELENSKAFDKVVFIEVPNPVDEKKIQDEIAKKLELKLEDGKDLTHAEQIWIRITNAGSVLIILDDVWEELKLENIGIHHGIHSQGRCCVLLTTRYETICRRMSCQKTIKLGLLHEEDAVNLFLHHATENGKDCPNKLKLLASKVVIECGNLPVVIVAVARTFRNWDPNEWEDAFAVIEKDSSLRHGNIDEEVKKFYNSLKISFKCLDRGAQDLILLCSIFPRAYEIPVEVLSRIAIGSGLVKMLAATIEQEVKCFQSKPHSYVLLYCSLLEKDL
ncbi:probable disease resistance protein At4g27220 [Neltuma alba]|uniref:probable disease resistance protein At4g27220 n=1 Tax=Neltuma alba TaxID=207710 RepID=UPI0010A53EDC|nr:probable disease resistance protein At4g27220 [Prosopis alba]